MFVRVLVLVIAGNFLSGCATMHAVDIGERQTWPSKFESVELKGERLAVWYTAVIRASGTGSRIVDQDVSYTGEIDFNGLVWRPLSTWPGVCKMPVRELSETEDISFQRQVGPAEQSAIVIPVSSAPSKGSYAIDPEYVRRTFSEAKLEKTPFMAYAAERGRKLTLVRVAEDGRTLEWAAVVPGRGTRYTEPWAYPVRVVVVPVALLLDLVTLPIQVLVVVNALSNF